MRIYERETCWGVYLTEWIISNSATRGVVPSSNERKDDGAWGERVSGYRDRDMAEAVVGTDWDMKAGWGSGAGLCFDSRCAPRGEEGGEDRSDKLTLTAPADLSDAVTLATDSVRLNGGG